MHCCVLFSHRFKQELESSDKKTKDLLVAIREGLYKWIKKYDGLICYFVVG